MTRVSTYELTITCPCPVDTTIVDLYRLTVTHPDMVQVEQIIAAASKATETPEFQENVTAKIHALLPGASVTTVGMHSGVKTTCCCS